MAIRKSWRLPPHFHQTLYLLTQAFKLLHIWSKEWVMKETRNFLFTGAFLFIILKFFYDFLLFFMISSESGWGFAGKWGIRGLVGTINLEQGGHFIWPSGQVSKNVIHNLTNKKVERLKCREIRAFPLISKSLYQKPLKHIHRRHSI